MHVAAIASLLFQKFEKEKEFFGMNKLLLYLSTNLVD